MRSKVLLGILFAVAACIGEAQSAPPPGSLPPGAKPGGSTASGTPPGGGGGSGAANDIATITFPDSGTREVWVQAAPCTGPTPDSIRPSEGTVDVPLTGKNPTDNVYIWDHKTGDLAVATVAELRKALSLSLDPKAFKDVAEVKVLVEHNGQALAAAEVAVDDNRKSQTQLLDPSTNGTLTFYDLKPGSLKVTARYKAKDGSSKTVTQLVDAELNHGDPAAKWVISIPDDVATVAPASTTMAASTTGVGDATSGSAAAGTSSSATSSTGAKSSGNPIGSAFGYLLGLLVVFGIVYGLWRYARQNPDLVATKLHQLGVDVPKPGDDPRQFDPVGAPTPRKPDPPQKIILPDAAPDLLAPVAASNVVTVTGEPRLLSETGDAMTLPPGETVVGREAGLGLSLVGESTVSRRHASMTRSGNEVVLTDLGSTNGTYINGAALTGPQTLRPGDTVQFGSVRFRFQG